MGMVGGGGEGERKKGWRKDGERMEKRRWGGGKGWVEQEMGRESSDERKRGIERQR